MTERTTPEAGMRLAPCPFCGGADVETRSQDMTGGPAFYWHICGHCAAESAGDYGEEKAVARWNTRAAAPVPPAGGEGEALRAVARMREVATDWRRPELAQVEGPNDLKIYGGTIADDIDRWADLLAARAQPPGGGALRLAAQDVIDRWDTPSWKDAEATAHVINRLRLVLKDHPAGEVVKFEGGTIPNGLYRRDDGQRLMIVENNEARFYIARPAEQAARLGSSAAPIPTEQADGAVVAALKDLLVAVTYAAPARKYAGVLAYEARVPVEFVENADRALATTAAETGAVGTSAASEQNGGGSDPIKAALDAYHDALIRRENGNIAGFRLIDAIEAHYGQSMDTRRTALAAGGEK